MRKTNTKESDESADSVVIKFTANRSQLEWLRQEVGRGNVSEFIRSKLFGIEYTRNTLPAARYRWELAVALNWVGNNLQGLTQKIDDLIKVLEARKSRETELIAVSAIVQLHKSCAETLIRISQALSGKGDGGDHPTV